jgi:hypothetical protein
MPIASHFYLDGEAAFMDGVFACRLTELAQSGFAEY